MKLIIAHLFSKVNFAGLWSSILNLLFPTPKPALVPVKDKPRFLKD
jgi:hypothetical protein